MRLHDITARHGDAEGDSFGKTEEHTYINKDGEEVVEIVPDIENIIGSAHDDVLAGDTRENMLYGGDGDDKLYGGPRGDENNKDYLDGGAGNDKLFGGIGNDRLEGGDGDDELWGGPGSDYLSGGAGNDMIYIYGEDGTVNGGLGNDTISYEMLTGPDGVIVALSSRLIMHIENIIGTPNDDTLTGNDGNNVIEGGGGADVLDGGAGTDTVSYASSNDGIRVSLADGTGSGGHASGDTISNFENVTGSMYNDELTGGRQDNVLKGLAGDDKLVGGGGNDTLEGGAGADMLDGGSDFLEGDTLSYASSTSGVSVDLAAFTASGGHASGDIIVFNQDVDHDRNPDTDSIDVVTFEHVTGSDHNDSLTGDHRHNVLRGGKGDDTLRGGSGADTLIGGPGADVLDGGEGISRDIVSYVDSEEAVTVDLSASVGIGMGGDAEGDTLINIEKVIGSRYGDTFILSTTNDNDMIVGGDSDYYDRDDTVSYEAADRGVKVTLLNDGQFSGFDNSSVEHITGSDHDDSLKGDENDNILKGGNGDDTLKGLYGMDRLEGGAGRDKLDGGEGSDILTGGTGDDIFVFNPDDSASNDTDTILDFSDGNDKIDLSAFGFASIDDLEIREHESAVMVDLSDYAYYGEWTIMILGIDMASLDADDFIL